MSLIYRIYRGFFTFQTLSFLVCSFFSAVVFAQGLDPDLVSRIFRKPVYIGASITAETTKRSFIIREMVFPHFLTREVPETWWQTHANDGGNPSHWAFEQMMGGAERPQYFVHTPSMDAFFVLLVPFNFVIIENSIMGYLDPPPRPSIEDILTSEFEAVNFAFPFSEKREADSGHQIHQLISESGQMHPFYQNASMVSGIDLFYWEAATAPQDHYDDRSCHPRFRDFVRDVETEIFVPGTRRQTRSVRQRIHMNVNHTIAQLVEKTFEDGKVLVLATVPEESSDFVNLSPDFFLLPRDGFSCLRRVNELLRQFCVVEKNCYLVDFFRLVKDLQNGIDLNLFGERAERGEGYNYHDFRGIDGVHLTQLGTELVGNMIKRALENHPPRFQLP